MNHHTQVAVIGGTGKSGKFVVRELIARKIPFKMLVHAAPAEIENHPFVTFVQGDARDWEVVNELLSGCQAVISTLGQTRGASPVFCEVTSHVLAAMKEHGISRYIVTTGLHVDTPQDTKGARTAGGTQWMKENYPLITIDKQQEYDMLVSSRVDWTLVRLPWIELTEERGPAEIVLEDCPGERINAADLASFLVDQLEDDRYLRKAPFIVNL